MVRLLYGFNIFINWLMYIAALMFAAAAVSYGYSLTQSGVSALVVIMLVFSICACIFTFKQARYGHRVQRYMLAYVRQDRRRYLAALSRLRKVLEGLNVEPIEGGGGCRAFTAVIADENVDYQHVAVVSTPRNSLTVCWLVSGEMESRYNPESMRDEQTALAHRYRVSKGALLVSKSISASPVDDGSIMLKAVDDASYSAFVAGIGWVRNRLEPPMVGMEYASCDELEELADILEQTNGTVR